VSGLLELQASSHHEPTIDLPRREIQLLDAAVTVTPPFRRDKLHLDKYILQVLVFISVAFFFLFQLDKSFSLQNICICQHIF
jgi:hypothetical protein